MSTESLLYSIFINGDTKIALYIFLFDRSALYTGIGPVLTSLYCSNFVYFYAFNGLRMLDVVKQLPLTQSVRDLTVGMVAGKFPFHK